MSPRPARPPDGGFQVVHPTVLEEPESGGLAGVLVADQGHGEPPGWCDVRG